MHRLASWVVATVLVCAQNPDFDRLKARAEREIFTPGSRWDLLGAGYHLTGDSTADREGNVFFTHTDKNQILKIDLAGKISVWKEDTNGAHGIAYGPDGRLYAGQHDRKRIVAFSSDGTESVIAEGVQSHHLTVTSRNHVYFNVPPAHQVWMVHAAGNKRVVHQGLNWPRGVRASPDESRLVVNDPPTRWVWSFEIQADGSLKNGKQFYRLETSGEKGETDAGGMAFDSAGQLYVATDIGVQVCDRQGKVIALIGAPFSGGVASVFFGGRGQGWLYVTDGDKVYRRPVKRPGARLFNGK